MSNKDAYCGNLHVATVCQTEKRITINLAFINENFETFNAELYIENYIGDTPQDFATALRELADGLERSSGAH